MKALWLLEKSNLVHKSVLDQCPKSFKCVPYVNFLSLRILTRVKRNRHLKDPYFSFQQFCCDFRFEIEPLGIEGDRLDKFRLEELVACFHVRENTVVKNICKKREPLVGDHMPEHGHPAGRT